jgi:hypothetical protein
MLIINYAFKMPPIFSKKKYRGVLTFVPKGIPLWVFSKIVSRSLNKFRSNVASDYFYMFKMQF